MKTHPKISVKTHQFWKTPKFFQKPQNLGFNTWNAWIWKRLEAYQVKKNLKKLEETLRIKIGVRWDCLGEKRESYREREIELNEAWIARGRINSASVNLDRWRCREVLSHLSRKVSRKWSSTDTGIEEVSRNRSTDTRTESRSIHQVSRSYRGGRNFLDRSTRCQEAVEIAIRKS